MIEPNCDMPWDIYLDWLQDQGNEDLRFIDIFNLTSGFILPVLEDRGDGAVCYFFAGETNIGGHSTGGGNPVDCYFGDGTRIMHFDENSNIFRHTYGCGNGD